MIFEEFGLYNADDIKGLYTSVFSNSEGEKEGLLISNLAYELMIGTDLQDIFGFVATKDNKITGCIISSRLRFESKKMCLSCHLLPSILITRVKV